MPVILESSDRNELEFKNGEKILAVLYYKDPSPTQQVAYSNRVVSRKGRKVKMDQTGTRLAGGKAVCTGMREGDFAVPAKNKKGYVLISSDPKSKDYRKDWKDLLYKHQAKYLILLGQHAFEGDVTIGDDVELDSGDSALDDDQSEITPEKGEGEQDELGK